jgi:tetratricopeptide (TPR) repeat protein
MDDPHVGTIVLHRLANVEGSAVSMTSLQAPKEARKSYDRALQDLRRNKLPEAAKELRKALDIYPNYAAAWYELGRIQEQDREIEQARESFAHAVAADAKFISPYVRLAELEAGAENWAELADTTSRLLKLDAVDYPMAYFYNATANLNLGQMDAAERSARAGEKLDALHRHPKIEQVLAMILERKKDYAGAAAHLRSYLLLAPDTADAARMKKELAELDRLSGANEQANAAVQQ